jgi:hypothetical protein
MELIISVPLCIASAASMTRGVRAVDAAGHVHGGLDGSDEPLRQLGLLADEDTGVDVDKIRAVIPLIAHKFRDALGLLLLDDLPHRFAAGVDQLTDNQHNPSPKPMNMGCPTIFVTAS